MIALIQRVSESSVTVDREVVGQIGPGLLVLAAVEPGDGSDEAARLAERLANYRIFPDAADRMNRSLRDTGGSMLLVPQFTLAADTRKGLRPSFATAATPELGRQLFDVLVEQCRHHVPGTVATGRFGAHMQVRLTNEGPVTFLLRVPPAAATD